MNKLFFQTVLFLLTGIFISCTSGKKEVNSHRPNILFALADDISYPYMGAYGTDWIETPAFDKVAERGILFNRAYTPNSKCSPSRASFLTGRNSWQLESGANHVVEWPVKFKTFTDALTAAGYHVGYTGRGYDPRVNGEQVSIGGKAYNEFRKEPPTNHMSSVDYVANFNAFMEERKEGQPFFFWYSASEPHRRYEFKSGARLAGKKPSDIDEVPAFWPDNDTVRHDMLDFAFEIEYFDRQLQIMLDKLEEMGELENTLIIVTADNGMPFPRIKGQEYEISTHMPLAMMWGDGIKNPGREVDDFVNFIDFAPTFLELAKADGEAAGMQPVAGKSLTGIFYSEKEGVTGEGSEYVLVGKERHDVGRPNDVGYPIRGIVKGNYYYLHNFEPDRWPAGNPETGYTNTDASPTKTVILNENRRGVNQQYWELCFGKRPKEELYDLENDFYNINNLADDPEYTEIKEELRKELFKHLKEQEDPRMSGRGEVFEQYPYARDNSRNFYPRFMRGDKTLLWAWIDSTDVEWNLTDSIRRIKDWEE